MSERRQPHRPLDAVPETHELDSYPTPKLPSPGQSEADPHFGFTNKTRNSEASGRHEEDCRDNGDAQAGQNDLWIVRWWKDNIAKAVPIDDDVRDHFALERTFLAFIRTANALASSAIAMYQLSRLSQFNPSSQTRPIHPRILTLEKAIALILIFGALLLPAVGAWRFFTRQKKIERGKVRAGGLDLWGVGGAFTVVEIMLFISILLN